MKKTSVYKIQTLKRVLKIIKKQHLLVILSILFAGLQVALSLYAPILVGRAIDCMIAENQVDFHTIKNILLNLVVEIILSGICQWLMNIVNNKITFEVSRNIRGAAFSHLQKMPVSYIDSHRHGDIISRIITDVDQFTDGLLLGLTQLFTGVITILGTLVFMLTISPVITLAVVVLTPLSLCIANYISKHTHDMFKKQSETRGVQTSFINETISNQKVVKAFNYENPSIAKFENINEELSEYSLKATFYSSLVNPSTRFINSIIYAVVALLGSFFAIGGIISVGGIACFLSYSSQYAKPFNEISGVIAEFQNAIVCAARVFELIDEPAEQSEPQNVINLVNPKGAVKAENVDFSYLPNKKIINNLNFSVKPGSKIAIVGPTGCGKTTVINLLMRFYNADSGNIFVDGNNIQNISKNSLRRNFGIVLQDTWLTSGTVAENIAYGKPNANMDEIIKAAKAAFAHGFIMRLENGYDTVIGEHNSSLSAGEKQLISIARVMLSNPPMLILDEATSSIDTLTEIKVQSAFTKLMEGRTCFIVAHRLSTIKNADNILSMKSGKIVESGTHNQLQNNGGYYSYLYNSQFNTENF